jgi:glycine oxidase
MITVDYLIVGQGLAGSAVAQRFLESGISFRVFDQHDQHQASRVASGIWNPIVLKRLKKVWQADAMLDELIPFYRKAEEWFAAEFIDDITVSRLFADDKEIDTWLTQCDTVQFEKLLSPVIKRSGLAGIDMRSGWATVSQSGRINTAVWLDAARKWLLAHELLISDAFQYRQLQISDHSVLYGDIKASGVIFCEGMHAAMRNPYFDYLPFSLTKGEVLIIRSEALNLEQIINSSVFILPLGEHLYKVGATYAWDDLSLKPTTGAREQLLDKAKRIINVPFEVIAQKAGIRPTTKDRRPLLGTHPHHPQLHIFNGMGSRGVLMVPYLSSCFVEYLCGRDTIPEEANINRFAQLIA